MKEKNSTSVIDWQESELQIKARQVQLRLQ